MYTILQYITPTHVVPSCDFCNHCWGRLPRYVCSFSAWVCIRVNVIIFTRVCLLLLISEDIQLCVSLLASGPAAVRRPPRPLTPEISHYESYTVPLRLPFPQPPLPPLPLLLPSLPTTLWIKKKLMQMMHSLSHCLFHSVDGYRDDSNIGETTDVKLLPWLEGVCVHSV